jgi:hypothetical protein
MHACIMASAPGARAAAFFRHFSECVLLLALQIFFVFGLVTNLVVSALLVLGGSAVITAVTGVLAPQIIPQCSTSSAVCAGEGCANRP